MPGTLTAEQIQFRDTLYHFGHNFQHFMAGLLGVGAVPDPGLLQEPLLETHDIQGNILPGFFKINQAFMFLEIIDVEATRAWLRFLEPHIATAEEVYAFKFLYKAMRGRRGRNYGTVQSTWNNIAFTFRGISKLTDDADQFTDEAFKQDLAARADLLGMPADEQADGHPANWIIGGEKEPDIMILIASDHAEGVALRLEWFEATMPSGLRVLHVQEGTALPPPNHAKEHFGYADGIGQPGVRGRHANQPEVYITARQNPADPNQGLPGQNLVWPGEFVFGYPEQSSRTLQAAGAVAEAGPPWARNGSYLVFQRYRQEVEAFRHFVQDAAEAFAHQDPVLADLTPEKLGAKLVGRWPSGAPLSRVPDEDLPALGTDRCANNHFSYVEPTPPLVGGQKGACSDAQYTAAKGDLEGLHCPHASHIRKAYPRDHVVGGQGAAQNERHRMLRRGITFGSPYPAPGDRGLLFVSYQTSIERQFEFAMRHWANNPNYPYEGAGYDAIIGQRREADRERTFAYPVIDEQGQVNRRILDLPDDLVIPTGGAYFFVPSLSALKYLASVSTLGMANPEKA